MNDEQPIQESENSGIHSIFDPAILAQLGDFRLQVRRLTAGLTFGEHASIRLGVSTDFQDHQPWEFGNDPKFIDWRVFARTGKLFKRRFKEDTNSVFYFLNDFSFSMKYNGDEIQKYSNGAGNPSPSSEQKNRTVSGKLLQKRLSKLEYARCMTAVMVYLALQQRDLVGLCAFNGSSVVSLRASTGENHWSDCLKFLENPPFPASDSAKHLSFSEVLNAQAAASLRRGKIFVLSDLLDVDAWEAILPQLKLLVAQGNELVFFHVLDPDELEFPFDCMSQFVGLENPEQRLKVSADGVRSEYLQLFNAWQKTIADGCRALGISYIAVNTSTPIHKNILY